MKYLASHYNNLKQTKCKDIRIKVTKKLRIMNLMKLRDSKDQVKRLEKESLVGVYRLKLKCKLQ